MASDGRLPIDVDWTDPDAIKRFTAGVVNGLAPDALAARRKKVSLGDLMIRDPDRNIVPLVPNHPQQLFLDDVCPRWRSGDFTMRRRRRILLKARKEGFSTLIAALFFIDTLNNEHTYTVQLSDTDENTEKLFDIVRRFWEYLPDEKRPGDATNQNRREFRWAEIGSTYYIGTAGSRNFGRGSTPTNFHGSEVAFWSNLADTFAGMGNAVAENGNVFLETTANGFNRFKEEWDRASENPPRSRFAPMFFPWYLMPEYSITEETALALREQGENVVRPSEVKLDHARMSGFPDQEHADLVKEEVELRKSFNVTWEQLAWRRGKWMENREKLPQEFPSTPEEAFVSSGKPYFDAKILQRIHLQLQSPEWSPLRLSDAPEQVERMPTGLRAAAAQLSAWEWPRPGHRYIVSADPSEGLSDDGVHNACSADVLDGFTGEQVAHLYGRWPDHEFGGLLADLGWFYNFALVVVERNNHGHSVLNTLMNAREYPEMDDDGWWSGGIYLHEEYDAQTKLKNRKAGWPTTPKTKFEALGHLDAAIREGEIGIRSRQTVKELRTFVNLPNGKAGADSGQFDDCVSSLAIGVAVWRKHFREATAPLAGNGGGHALEVGPVAGFERDKFEAMKLVTKGMTPWRSLK